MVMSAAEAAFLSAWLEAAGEEYRPSLVSEYRFHPRRKWRFDFACPRPDYGGIAIEIEGEGRHRSFGGFRSDMEKYNAAAALNWQVFRLPASSVMRNPAAAVDEIWQLICGQVPEESSL